MNEDILFPLSNQLLPRMVGIDGQWLDLDSSSVKLGMRVENCLVRDRRELQFDAAIRRLFAAKFYGMTNDLMFRACSPLRSISLC